MYKLLPLGRVSGYNFRYFTSDGSFTKADIISKLALVDEAKKYLPDDANIKNLTRDYLLSVRFYIIFQLFSYIDPNGYCNMYNAYKIKMAQRLHKKWTSYHVEISQELSEKLKSFNPASL